MKKNLTKSKTERGFTVYEFTDGNGVGCSLQKSSAGTQDMIWLGWTPGDRMHLNQKQVAELLPIMQKFVKTGEI